MVSSWLITKATAVPTIAVAVKSLAQRGMSAVTISITQLEAQLVFAVSELVWEPPPD